MDKTARAASIAELQALLLTAVGAEDFLAGAAAVVARHVGPAQAATITLVRGARPPAVGASDRQSATCDEVEFPADDSPGLTAISRAEGVIVPDVEAGEGWPAWRNAAHRCGYASAFALARTVRSDVHLALILYAVDRAVWGDAGVRAADAIADELTRSTALWLRATDALAANADLRAALASRALIDQATGVVMAENRCSADEAMTVLRSASEHREVALQEVAAVIIEAVTGSPPRVRATFQPRM